MFDIIPFFWTGNIQLHIPSSKQDGRQKGLGTKTMTEATNYFDGSLVIVAIQSIILHYLLNHH